MIPLEETQLHLHSDHDFEDVADRRDDRCPTAPDVRLHRRVDGTSSGWPAGPSALYRPAAGSRPVHEPKAPLSERVPLPVS